VSQLNLAGRVPVAGGGQQAAHADPRVSRDSPWLQELHLELRLVLNEVVTGRAIPPRLEWSAAR
jgi:hypothetical protein